MFREKRKGNSIEFLMKDKESINVSIKYYDNIIFKIKNE